MTNEKDKEPKDREFVTSLARGLSVIRAFSRETPQMTLSEVALKAEVIGAMEAIVSATRTSAEILRAGDDLGTVAVGRYADVIAVAGDPLADPHVLADDRNVVLVVKGGRVVKDSRS